MPRSSRFVGHTATDQRTLVFENPHEGVEGAGTPPHIQLAPGDWWSEFTNEFGEKWIAYLNARRKELRFYSGDLGWNDPVQPLMMREGITLGSPNQSMVMLNLSEQQWMMWAAQETRDRFMPTKASKGLQDYQDAFAKCIQNLRGPFPKPKDYGLEDEPDLPDDEDDQPYVA